MTNIDKIRAALEQEPGASRGQALAALAELERAAAEPLFLLTTGAIGSDGEQDDWDIECDSLRRLDAFCAAHPGETVKLYTTTPPAPVAQKFEAAEVTQEMCARVAASFYGADTFANGVEMHEALQLWQRELGPTLGLAVMREPTAEECERIYDFWVSAEGCCGRTPGQRMGRLMADAVRAVMGGKS